MRVYVVDAFTDRLFAGNSAGVVVLDRPADDAWMQALAAEMNHPETAFVRARDDGTYELRWFAPAAEVDLCGHATLATAHALHGSGAETPFVFHTRSGALTATQRAGVIELDFPAQPVHPIAPPPGLAEGLGVPMLGTYANGVDVLVEVADAGTVGALAPDMTALREVECRGVIVTAPAPAGADHDFVSRFFSPRLGIAEDPVTGSAHCALGPFWAQRLGRAELVGTQLSARGGRVGVAVDGERVRLTGQAVTVLEGEVRGLPR
jgi:PhzF family phenazine biosynthesis protein